MKDLRQIREARKGSTDLGPSDDIPNKNYLAKVDPRFGLKWPKNKSIPNVLMFKRKAIRVYPDNQKVALYYTEQLDKYITIPFGENTLSVNEEHQLNELSPDAIRNYIDLASLHVKSGEMSPEQNKQRIKYIRKASRKLESKLPRDIEAKAKKAKARFIKDFREKERENKKTYQPVAPGWQGVGDLAARAVIGTTKLAAKAVGGAAKLAYRKLTAEEAFQKHLALVQEQQVQQEAAGPILTAAAAAARTAASVARSPAVRAVLGKMIQRGAQAAKGAGRAAGRGLAAAGRGLARGVGGVGQMAGAALSALTGGNSNNLGPVQAKNVEFAGNRIVRKSRPERVTAQGGVSSPTQEVQYRNQLMRMPMNESVVEQLANEQKITINTNTAKKIVNLYENLNLENQETMRSLLTTVEGFKKVVDFTNKV